ncbi:MAG: BON domain-containing protein [Caulobacterales bacterium]
MTLDDKALRNHVLDELDYDPSIDAAGIAVTAHNGVVTLAGHVPTLAQKLAAKETAARIKGVRAIVQELEVASPQAPEDDEDLAERAANLLSWMTALPQDTIKVEVSRGVVTLTGEVEWDYQRRIAEQEVRNLAGILDLNNLITLKFQHPADDTKGRIEEALARNAFSLEDVHVTAEKGAVTLSGAVRSWFDCDLADRLAWSAPGVHSVDNRLVVQGESGQELLA